VKQVTYVGFDAQRGTAMLMGTHAAPVTWRCRTSRTPFGTWCESSSETRPVLCVRVATQGRAASG
jgi:hypothetical protein